MGTEKAAITVGGHSLLERAVARVAEVADPVILATGDSGLEHRGCLHVADAVPQRGPLGGLVAVLRATPHLLCAVVAVDMPDLDPRLLRALAAMWDGEDAVVPASARGPEPLHAVYARSALAGAAAALAGDDSSLTGMLARLRVRVVPAAEVVDEEAAARFATNINRPEDLESWSRAAAAPPPQPPR
jgi:molybdopterin-guanine dinucleotide biosynthesis protein A